MPLGNLKVHISMPSDGQSNIYLYNGIRAFSQQHSIPIDLTFTDHRNQSIERAVDYINQINPDICLFLYLNDLGSFIDYVKCGKKCGWIFDVTFGGKEIPESSLKPSIEKLDYFFTICPEHAKALKGYWVPEGYDPCSHFPVYTNSSYDITFVGQVVEDSPAFKDAGFVHLDREKWLVSVARVFKRKLQIFGKMYGDVLVSEFHTNKYLSTAWDNNIVSSMSNINLGHSGWPKVKYSWSARDYRVMAAGGFLITNKIKGHNDFFKDGRDIVLYESNEECTDKIGYYLNKPNIREKIALKGMEKVKSSFSFCHSFEKMFTHLGVI